MTNVLLSNWEIIFIASKLSRNQWQMLVDPLQQSSSDIETLTAGENLFGEQFNERELRYDKVFGVIGLVAFVLMHVTWLIRLRASTRRAKTPD